MSIMSVVVISVFIIGVSCDENFTFPSWFLFGASTAAYQVEGGWNESDKGESIWDRLIHTRPDVVVDRSNGDVACDSYHLWKRDVNMAQELGLSLYRFSISWPRILPSGFPNHISEDGVNYYNNLIDGLLEKGIEPLVTMYHWDLPQYLQDLGGWANPLISTWFGDYARVLYTLFGDRVKYWITLNEPLVICDGGYGKMAAPYLDDTKIGLYLCNKNVLLAHAEAYRIYDREFRHVYHGRLSLSMIFFWFEPETPEDAEATKLTLQFWIYPEGFGKQLRWIKETYGVNDILITENGLPTFSPDIYDLKRVEYIRNNLEQVHSAINDGINVMGYTAWSLMDNFEWTTGYIPKYGLYAVDFSTANRTRTPRESARFFASVARTRSVLRQNHELNYEET